MTNPTTGRERFTYTGRYVIRTEWRGKALLYDILRACLSARASTVSATAKIRPSKELSGGCIGAAMKSEHGGDGMSNEGKDLLQNCTSRAESKTRQFSPVFAKSAYRKLSKGEQPRCREFA